MGRAIILSIDSRGADAGPSTPRPVASSSTVGPSNSSLTLMDFL